MESPPSGTGLDFFAISQAAPIGAATARDRLKILRIHAAVNRGSAVALTSGATLASIRRSSGLWLKFKRAIRGNRQFKLYVLHRRRRSRRNHAWLSPGPQG